MTEQMTENDAGEFVDEVLSAVTYGIPKNSIMRDSFL